MIAAVGTLLAGLVALASFAVSQHWFDSRGPDDPPHATGSNGKPLPKLDEAVLFGPDKTILMETSVDFDTDPPGRGISGSDTYNFFEKLTSSYGMVRWNGDKKPSQNDCHQLLATHGSGSEEFAFDAGDRFCVKTDMSRIAYFEVVRKTETGWEISVTSWKQRVDKD
jgi:hypothetical protein